jgi:hypothetical protein
LLWKYLFLLYLAAAMVVAAPAVATPVDPALEVARAAPAADPVPSPRWNLLAEAAKQAAEQPLHFLMSAGPIWLSRCLTAVPWYGWAVVPALAYREWRQWPSKRWWDPALDAAFFILGVVAATWSGRAGPLPVAAMLRRGRRAAPVRLVPATARRPLPAEHASS